MTVFMSVAFCLKLAKSKTLHPNLTIHCTPSFTVPHDLVEPCLFCSYVCQALYYTELCIGNLNFSSPLMIAAESLPF